MSPAADPPVAPDPSGATDPYARLAALAHQELAHAEAGDLDALADLQARRAALVAGLPAVAPAHARPALERAAAAQRRVDALLGAARAELAERLGHLGRGRRAARSYAAAVGASHSLDRPA